jgi:hypothetical protein
MSSHEPDPTPDSGSKVAPPLTGMPRWVKGLLITALVVALLIAAAMLLLGGEHGPGRHMSTMPPSYVSAIQTWPLP